MKAEQRPRYTDARFTRAKRTAIAAVTGVALALLVAYAFAGYLAPAALLALLSGLTFCG